MQPRDLLKQTAQALRQGRVIEGGDERDRSLDALQVGLQLLQESGFKHGGSFRRQGSGHRGRSDSDLSDQIQEGSRVSSPGVQRAGQTSPGWAATY